MSNEKLQQVKERLATKLINILKNCKLPEHGFSFVVEEQHTSICFVNGLWALADNYNGAELIIVHEAPADHAVLSDITVFQLNELMRYLKSLEYLLQGGVLKKLSPEPLVAQRGSTSIVDVKRHPIKPIEGVRF